jgi:hypothetical protein
MSKRTTLLATLLLAVSLLTMLIASARMTKLHEDAGRARDSAQAVAQSIDHIHRWKTSPGQASSAPPETPQLTSQLRQAAAAAALNDTPGSEPNTPTRLANTDYTQTLVFLRFEPLTLQQLTTFLIKLNQIDPTSRPKTIELSTPDPSTAPQATQSKEERWIADVAVAYLTYSPQKTTR